MTLRPISPQRPWPATAYRRRAGRRSRVCLSSLGTPLKRIQPEIRMSSATAPARIVARSTKTSLDARCRHGRPIRCDPTKRTVQGLDGTGGHGQVRPWALPMPSRRSPIGTRSGPRAAMSGSCAAMAGPIATWRQISTSQRRNLPILAAARPRPSVSASRWQGSTESGHLRSSPRRDLPSSGNRPAQGPCCRVARGSAGRAVGRWLRAGQVADGVAIGGGLDAGLRFHDQGRWHRSAPCAPLASTAQPPRSGHRERGSPLASKGRRLRPTGSTGRTAGPGARLRLGCDGGLPSLARRRPGIWRRGPGRRASASIGRCEGGRRT